MYVPEIRFCGPGDLPAVLSLNAVSPFPWPEAVILGDFKAGSETQVSYLGAFAATQAGLLGYAVLGRETDAGLLMALFVRPEYRRRRIGTQLLSAVADCAVWLGFNDLRLRVRRSNTAALALYRRMFFIQEGTFSKYYSDGEDAIVMKAALPLGKAINRSNRRQRTNFFEILKREGLKIFNFNNFMADRKR